jgi:class 3 adenylate cyclase/pimeloyl-ACP methyl ester carboxylesterase
METSVQFVKRKDGVKLAYSKFGKGEPLVCPAPWVTSLSYIFEDPFAKRFWTNLVNHVTVVAYDKHGCGLSDRNREHYTVESEILDFETVVDHLDFKKFNVLGSSMAGPVTVEYTYRHPDRINRLILYGAYADGKSLAPEKLRSALVQLVEASWGIGSKALAEIFLPGASGEELHSFAMFQRESTTPEIASKLLELSYSINVTEFLPYIKAPTLILHREGDKLIPKKHSRQLATEIPNARMKMLTGKIHPWWYGNTDEIIQEILKFLEVEHHIFNFNDTSKSENEVKISKQSLSADDSKRIEQATIVFSDIVSSTELVTKLGDTAAREIIKQHDIIISDQVKIYRGRVLQNLGDGFMLSFEYASSAIKCACAIQKKISRNLPTIKIRIGINTGEVVLKEGKHPFGQAVVIASRIVSEAKGGEIIVSDVIKQITSGSKFTFIDKGWFKLKGIDEKVKLYEISWKE